MKKIMVLMIVLVVNVLAGDKVTFYTPSFDCTKVKENSIEYKICTDKELSQLDKELSKVYGSFYFISKEIKNDQIAWIKRRNRCKNNSCIKNRYRTRIEDLNTSLSNQDTFPKKILDFMKKSQKAVKIELSRSKEKQEFTKDFFKDLFTFKNIRVNKPILNRVDYNNTIFKELISKDCWDMRLDYAVRLTKEYQSGVKEYKGYLIKEFSLRNVDMDGDGEYELMFTQHDGEFDYYNILNKKICKDFSFISYTKNCTTKSYPKIYHFYDDNRKLIYPFCTLNQQIVGSLRTYSGKSKDDVIEIINWKNKSYIFKVRNSNHSYMYGSGAVFMSLYGTNKLDQLGLKYFVMKKINKEK